MKTYRTLPFVFAMLLLLAACASTGGTTTTAAGVTTTGAAATTAATAGSPISVATGPLGEVLVDGEGFTLYILTSDAQGSPTCVDSCTANWPAVAGPVSAGQGIDGGMLGTTARTDGSQQATYNGWPLYRFAGDSAPGDTNGQGINDVWWVLSPVGEPMVAPTVKTATTSDGYN